MCPVDCVGSGELVVCSCCGRYLESGTDYDASYPLCEQCQY